MMQKMNIYLLHYEMFDHLKGSVDELGDVVRTFVMEARYALRSNSY